jgi:hypothetical protein
MTPGWPGGTAPGSQAGNGDELGGGSHRNIPYGREGALENPDFRTKWLVDGASTLEEAAGRLREFAGHLEQLERDGWQLARPVENSYAYVHYVGEGEPPRYDSEPVGQGETERDPDRTP